MNEKQIEVTCPCCESRLVIDVLTRSILRASAASQVDETGKVQLDESRWDSARQRVSERGTVAEDRLESALSAEREKESRLEDLFERAQEKLRRRDEDAEEREL
jgi:hypothetical protein